MGKSNYRENNNQEKISELSQQKPTVNEEVKTKPVVDLSKLDLEGGNINNNIQGQQESEVDVVETVQSIINSNSNVINALNNLNNSYGKLASALMDYEYKMNKKNSQGLDQNEIGSNNFNLYNRINKVLNITEYQEFIKHFDIVNFVFNKFKNSGYSEFAVNRADLYFTGDQKQLRTFQHMVTIICILCDPIKRAESKRVISVHTALDRNITTFTELAVNNIKQYYDL